MDEAIQLPANNQEYSESKFWEDRYSSEGNQIREWLGGYSLFSKHFRELVPDKNASILILGCGNSLLGEDLYEDGYRNIVNTDISPSVIKKMSKHCEKCSQMKWEVMDCLELSAKDQTIDVVLEKATIEVFLVEEKSLWNISTSSKEIIRRMTSEIDRVLKPKIGKFFSISFTAPHFRQILIESSFPKSLQLSNIFELGETFHFFMYCFSNSPEIKPKLVFSYEPPKVTKLEVSNFDENTNDDDNFFGCFDV